MFFCEVSYYIDIAMVLFCFSITEEVARPATPDFAAWRVEASPRYEEETGAQRSPRGEGTRAPPPEQSGLSQLRAALANKLSGIDFRGEAEKERVKIRIIIDLSLSLSLLITKFFY